MAMPERPLLILPSPGEPLPRRKRSGGGGSPHLPNRARQAERLNPRFEALQRALEARRVRLQTESHDLVPEDVGPQCHPWLYGPDPSRVGNGWR